MNTGKTISTSVRKLCAAILCAGLAASVGLLLDRRLELSRIEKQLVREALGLASARFERPAHRSPILPGTFGEHASQALAALAAARSGPLSAQEEQLLASVQRGAQPFAAAPARLRAALEEHRASLLALLEATHAEAARPPDPLTAPALDEASTAAVQLAARLLALEIVAGVEAGRATEALAHCTDGLALARDLSFGSALQGRMLATSVTRRLVTPCARAIDAAPAAAKREALRQLKAIRAATPAFAATIAEEGPSMTACTLGAALRPETLLQLPPRFRTAAQGGAAFAQSQLDQAAATRRFIRSAWPAIQDAWTALGATHSLGHAERRREWARVKRQLAESKNPIVSLAAAAVDPARFEPADQLARTQLELLIHAAALDLRRAESGRWPALLAELGPEVGAPADPEAQREAPLLYFVSESEQAASLEGGETELEQVTVTADPEVKP